MRKTGITLTILTLIAGAVGAVMRSYELKTVFDAETGLAEKNAPISLALIALSVLTVVVLFILSFRMRSVGGLGYVRAFGHSNVLIFALTLALGIITVLCGILQTVGSYNDDAISTGGTAWTIFAVLSGIAAVVMAFIMKRSGEPEKPPFSTVMPVVFLCLWLVLAYMDNVSNPVKLDYVYTILAIGFAILSGYYSAGFAFERGHIRRLVFCSNAALFFTMITMVGSITIYEKGALLALAALPVIQSLLLANNMRSYQEVSFDGSEL